MPLPIFQEETLSTPPVTQIRYTVAIAAGKGGVGKSTLTAQLAHALQRKGLSIGVLDSDLYGPSLRKMLPEDKPPSQRGSWLLPALSHGISLLSFAHFHSPQEAAIVRAPIANKIITQFLQNTAWGKLDLLLIDFPPGTGDIQLTLSQKAMLSGALAITTPQEIALIDVRKALSLFEQVQVPLLGIVENMSYYAPTNDSKKDERLYLFGQGGGARLAHENGVPLLGQIPLDPAICLCTDTGQSLWADPARSGGSAARAFEGIADQLMRALENGEKNPLPTLVSLSVSHDDTLILVWNDGLEQQHSLNKLQRACPCAACASATAQPPIDKSVTALQIVPIGRYALKITFSSGCSAGIYSFNLLRHFCST